MDWEGFFTHYRKPGFIPGYEIVNKLGSGVFGEVYKARKESIGKFYAIKFLKVSDEKISEAIFKELDTLRYFAQLDHPNLVSIEDKGEVMGVPFIVMGYAGDTTLKKRLAGGRIALDEARAIFSQVCAGVGALHEKSIIHFDLKPANIFMKDNHARVGDYGLSKLVSESHKTMSIGRGTPYYMAPEMLRRTGDNRSDIYSLGVILYEMMTGEVPFKGDSEWEVLKKHEAEDVVIPGSVPQPERGIIERALKKRPEARFQSVAEILAAFDGRSERTTGEFPTGGVPPVPRSVPVPPPVPTGGFVPRPANMPPLPTQRTGAGAARDVRRNVAEVVKRIKSVGGAAAERARVVYQGRIQARTSALPPRDPSTFDSFYSEFETDDRGERPADRAERGADDVADPTPRRRSRIGRFFHALFWPVRFTYRSVAYVLRQLRRGLGAFFGNFLRYALVLLITAGFCFLVYAAMRGFNVNL